MKSQALQELVRKVFSDEKTRQEFQSDPESVLKQFALTEQEKKAVMSTNARLGLVIGDSAQLAVFLDSVESWIAPTP